MLEDAGKDEIGEQEGESVGKKEGQDSLILTLPC